MSHFGFNSYVNGLNIGNDQNTKILLHFDGTNGGTTFTDSAVGSTHGTWSVNSGTVTTSTSSPKFGTAAGSFTAGSLTTADSTDFSFSTTDWTVDFWFKTAFTTGEALWGKGSSIAATTSVYASLNSSSLTSSIFSGSTQTQISAATNYTDNAWHHYALVKNGTNIYQFVDGVLKNTVIYLNAINTASTQPFLIGTIGGAATQFTGSMDEFRFSTTARWTAAFTPPTGAYT